jgi:hypothetical protein
MGQARDNSLEQLLLLGEPEAVVAVVHAAGLTDEIARRAWWAMPVADNARRMLEKDCVLHGRMGPVLAEYLVEYLPFETEHRAMIETVRLVLRPGLVGDATRDRLWRAAKRKNSYYVGFLDALPDALPEPGKSRHDWQKRVEPLQPLLEAQNPVAAQLCRCLSGEGQKYLEIAQAVMSKPANQDVVVELLNTIQRYFAPVCTQADRGADLDTIVSDAQALLDVLPECRDDIRAMLILAWVGEPLVNPIFARTDAIGSLMRKKIEPVTRCIAEQFAQLCGDTG